MATLIVPTTDQIFYFNWYQQIRARERESRFKRHDSQPNIFHLIRSSVCRLEKFTRQKSREASIRACSRWLKIISAFCGNSKSSLRIVPFWRIAYSLNAFAPLSSNAFPMQFLSILSLRNYVRNANTRFHTITSSLPCSVSFRSD